MRRLRPFDWMVCVCVNVRRSLPPAFALWDCNSVVRSMLGGVTGSCWLQADCPDIMCATTKYLIGSRGIVCLCV